jgi:hypothetical protein
MLDDDVAADRTVEIFTGCGGDPIENVLTQSIAYSEILARDAQTHGSPHP